MSEILNLDDLQEVVIPKKLVDLPVLSKLMGKPVSVEIKAIEPFDMLNLYNVPMDEINRMVADHDEGEIAQKTSQMMNEQIRAFTEDDYKKMFASVIKAGVIDPVPTDKFLEYVKGDMMHLFGEIMKHSTASMSVEDGARFRPDGER